MELRDLVPRLDVTALRHLFGPGDGATFTLVTSRRAVSDLRICGLGEYASSATVLADGDEAMTAIAALSGPQHVLTITSDSPFVSPSPETITNIKLAVVPLFSTVYSASKLALVAKIIQVIDYPRQAASAEKVLSQLAMARRISFRGLTGATAELDLNAAAGRIHYFNQSGPIGWGRQSVLPGGEVSLLTDGHGRYTTESKFQLDGVLEVNGFPVLHRGSCPCAPGKAVYLTGTLPSSGCPVAVERYVSDEELDARFETLACVAGATVLLRLRHGVVVDTAAATPHDETARSALEGFLSEDPNYRKIQEIGFGLLNSNEWFSWQNFLPNEMRRGVHFGFGLTPFTRLHLDLVCNQLSAQF